MASSHTANYNLSQWERTDKVLMEDFNADNAKIDGAVKAVDRRVDALDGSKADRAALDSLKALVDGHTSALSQRGNCQVGTFSYRGNGKYGSDNPTKLNFPKRPLLFIVFGEDVHAVGSRLASSLWTVNEDGAPTMSGSWSGNTFSFSNWQRADYQMNMSGQTYYVVAFYDLA